MISQPINTNEISLRLKEPHGWFAAGASFRRAVLRQASRASSTPQPRGGLRICNARPFRYTTGAVQPNPKGALP